MKYKEIKLMYCEDHNEWFSNNCSECMLVFNEPEIISKTCKKIAQTIDEIHKYTDNRITWIWQEGKLMESLKNGNIPES